MQQRIEVDNLATHIERAYTLRDCRLMPMARGLVSRTFRLETETGTYFVKCAHIGHVSQSIERSLPVLNALRASGFEHIPSIVPTQDGQLFTLFNYYLCVVYDFIAGSGGPDYDFDQYLGVITRLHQQEIPVPVYQETFEIPFDRVFQEHLRQLLRLDSSSDESDALRDLIMRRYQALLYHWKRFLAVAAECQHPRVPCPRVITHGDTPNSVRVCNAEQLYIVDWDDVRYAPPERDTWFHLFGGERQRFLSQYDPVFPDYRPNESALRFFVYYRFFGDLTLYLAHHMATDNPQIQRSYRQKLHHLFQWLEPIINQF